MKVLHLNYGDVGHGGASVAAYRLHRTLLDQGVQSHMRVASKASEDPAVSVARSYRRMRTGVRSVFHYIGLNELDGVSPYVLPMDPVFRMADIVHCHALQGDWFSYPALRLLARRKSMVITLHDMWPFTGHCSFSFECRRWETGCGSCPHLDTYPSVRRDATRIEWHLKHWTWKGFEPTVICPSEWIASLARRSMLSHGRISVIRHGLDLKIYAPGYREHARACLGIDDDRFVVLFAASSVDDPRKGGDVVRRVLSRLGSPKARVTVILLGGGGEQMAGELRSLGFDVRESGYVRADEEKARIYSSADAFLFPTKADNAPLVVLESMACGTPTMAFGMGGLGELIEDGSTGWLVPDGDEGLMTRMLGDMISNPDQARMMRSACRSFAVRNHSADRAAADHVAAYVDLLSKGPGTP